MDFIIYSLPRSRSFWASKFLTYGDYMCGHDEIRHARSLDDIRSFMKMPFTGSVETAGAPFWRLVQQYQPNIRTVTIRRPVDEVIDSIARLGYEISDVLIKRMEMANHKLDQIEHRIPNVMSIQFHDLDQEDTCKQLFEYCLGYQFDQLWYNSMSTMNLQVNMNHVIRYYDAHEPQLVKLAKTVKHQIISGMEIKEIDSDDGIVIREESFANWPDAKKLIEDHCVASGLSPDFQVNLPLLEKMAELGSLQVISARCNGRVQGYLLTVIGPSLEDANVVSAAQASFFASSEFKGLGMKLQRASIQALKDKGVHEVFLKAGIRGDASRLSTVYRRIGAAHFGELFRLDLTHS